MNCWPYCITCFKWNWQYAAGYCTGDNYRDPTPIDIFQLNTTTNRWTALKKPPLNKFEKECWPFQRYGHTVVSHGKKIYLFGGRNDNHSCNKLYCFDTEKHKWSCPEVCGYIPTARDGHTSCTSQDSMYVFGGYEDSVQLDDNERPAQVFRL